MSYDPVSTLFTLYAQQSLFDSSVTTTPIQLYMNTALYRYFPTLRALYINYTAAAKAFQIVIENDITNLSSGMLAMTEDSPSIGVWTQLQSIVFISTGIPTRAELLGSAVGTSQQIAIKFIQDFEPPVGFLYFNPVAQSVYQYAATKYRWIDLQSDLPLFNMDFQIYWRSKTNVLTLLQIEPGQVFTAKFAFKKKTLLT